ncbi:cytochrome p450 [Rhizoctonia solani]|uniref:Cytochrome p450 n=1 Tax=Rhizoctonia solani TaxID=456999 RepID=A0A8H7I5S6_9AGAM|nr:cytochrome p450 [Rhizoctonia solani]
MAQRFSLTNHSRPKLPIVACSLARPNGNVDVFLLGALRRHDSFRRLLELCKPRRTISLTSIPNEILWTQAVPKIVVPNRFRQGVRVEPLDIFESTSYNWCIGILKPKHNDHGTSSPSSLAHEPCSIHRLPAFALTAALRLARPARIPESKLLLSVLYVLAVPTFWGFRNVVRDRLREREAKRLGARVVPRVKGKWPGNIDIMLKLVKSLHGSYVASVCPRLCYIIITIFVQIVTIDHDVIKFILATGFNSFGKDQNNKPGSKGKVYQSGFHSHSTDSSISLLGDGIFNRDGDLWKFHRNMTRPFFVRERISEFDLFDKYAQKFLARMDEHTDTNVPMDIQDLYASPINDRRGMRIPLFVHMGARGTAAPTSYGSFVSAFDEAQGIIPIRGRMGPYIWPLAEWKGDKVMACRRVVNEWVAVSAISSLFQEEWELMRGQPLLESAIERRKEHLQNGGEKGQPAGDTFIDDLVSSTDDKMLVMDELVNMLIAARDTTASLLTFTTYLLTQHSNVFQTLRGEILEHYRASFLLYSAPPLAKTNEYTQSRVLNETLRLFPPVPINERATYATCTIPTSSGRLYIPSGVQVLFSPLVMQRRQDLWGADAWEFDPARWLDERNEMFIKDPMRFVPFNAGPRIVSLIYPTGLRRDRGLTNGGCVHSIIFSLSQTHTIQLDVPCPAAYSLCAQLAVAPNSLSGFYL